MAAAVVLRRDTLHSVGRGDKEEVRLVGPGRHRIQQVQHAEALLLDAGAELAAERRWSETVHVLICYAT